MIIVTSSPSVLILEWLATYNEQMHRTKALTSGGALKGIFRDMREEREDLIHVGGEDDEGGGEVRDRLAFGWRRSFKRYARKRKA